VSKGTKVELGGKERVLFYDLNAVADIGDKLGITVRVAYLGEDLMGTPLPPSALRTFVWGGLLHAEPDLDERTVGAWVTEENWTEIFQLFFARFSVTSPETQAQVMRAFGQEEETKTEGSAEVPEPATTLAS
jgi:hypothetical protein